MGRRGGIRRRRRRLRCSCYTISTTRGGWPVRNVRLGLVQFNTTVGDIARQRAALADASRGAGSAAAGSSPSRTRRHRLSAGRPRAAAGVLRGLARRRGDAAGATHGIVAIVGFVDWRDGDAYNAAAVFADGRWVDTYHKRRLPNYGVFDEERYFSAGRRVPVYRAGEVTFGVSVCEDIWYPGLPLDDMALGGAELCININASPYHRRQVGRSRMIATRAADNLIAVAYVNAVGGQDELVFDGDSLVCDTEGRVIARGDAVPGRAPRGRRRPRCRRAAAPARPAPPRRTPRPRHRVEVDHVGLDFELPFSSTPQTAARPSPAVAARGDVGRARPGHARLPPQDGLPARRSSGSQAASIRAWWRPSPWTPSARRTCSAWRCPAAIRATTARRRAGARAKTSAFAT